MGRTREANRSIPILFFLLLSTHSSGLLDQFIASNSAKDHYPGSATRGSGTSTSVEKVYVWGTNCAGRGVPEEDERVEMGPD